MLSKVAETGRDWDHHLPLVLFAYRNSVQESTKESPFYLLYRRDTITPSETEFISNLSNAWRLAKENIMVAQTQQNKQHDIHAKEHQFKIGD